jgi:hypothetical protein
MSERWNIVQASGLLEVFRKRSMTMRLMPWLLVSLVFPLFESPVRVVAQAPTPAQQATDSRIWIGKYGEFEEFLRTAKIERTSGTGVGVLAPRHAHFEPGGLANGAAVKKVKPGKRDGFFESYKSEIASYKLDRLLELNMVPPTVEIRYEGEQASAQLWVENVKMLSDIQKQGVRDPDAARWNRQLHRAQVFDSLVGNIDPNAGNWLFDPSWNFIKIDCSRCFTDTATLQFDIKKVVKKIDRQFFDRVKSLDRDAVRREISDLLTEAGAMTALFRRRDAIVKAFEELAKSQGEANVFEDWPSQ